MGVTTSANVVQPQESGLLIRTLVNTFKATSIRHKQIEDPSLKAMMKWERDRMFITSILGAFCQLSNASNLPPKLHEDFRQTLDELCGDLDEISRCMEQLNMGLDASIGKSLMQAAEKDFIKHAAESKVST